MELEIATASKLYEKDDQEGFLAVPKWTSAASIVSPLNIINRGSIPERKPSSTPIGATFKPARRPRCSNMYRRFDIVSYVVEKTLILEVLARLHEMSATATGPQSTAVNSRTSLNVLRLNSASISILTVMNASKGERHERFDHRCRAIGSALASQFVSTRIVVTIANNSQRVRWVDSLEIRCRRCAGGLGARLGTCYVPKRCLRQPIQIT
jgi:hypothetical protein